MSKKINPKKFNKVHELHALGIDAPTISKVLKNQGFKGCGYGTVHKYLKFDSIEDLQEYHRQMNKSGKKPATKNVSNENSDLNKAMDLIAEAYDILKHIK